MSIWEVKNGVAQRRDGSAAGGGASQLSELNDVEIVDPANNQVLKYNATTNKWENGNAASEVIVDSALSVSSSNPVKNSVIANALANGRIKFGVDANGKAGYKLDGADTVIPFKNGSENVMGDAVAENVLSGKYFSSAAAGSNIEGTMTNRGSVSQSLNPGSSYIIPKGYHDGTGSISARSLSLTSIDARGVRVIFEPYSKSESISYDWVDVIGHNGSSYVYARTGGTSTWMDAVVPTAGQQYIYIYWRSDSSTVNFGFKIAAIVPAYCTTAQGQSTGEYSSLPRSYDATVTLANARTIQTSHNYSNNEKYCWRVDISSLQTSSTASGDGYAKTIYVPSSATTSRAEESAPASIQKATGTFDFTIPSSGKKDCRQSIPVGFRPKLFILFDTSSASVAKVKLVGYYLTTRKSGNITVADVTLNNSINSWWSVFTVIPGGTVSGTLSSGTMLTAKGMGYDFGDTGKETLEWANNVGSVTSSILSVNDSYTEVLVENSDYSNGNTVKYTWVAIA